MSYIIPILLILLVCYSAFKGNNTYFSMVKGAKEAFSLVIDILPYIFTVFLMISLLRVSGLYDLLINVFSPICKVLGVPTELLSLIFVKHFSGSGSLAILQDIYLEHGVDSYLSKVASCIVGSSEAIFYVVAVYFAKTKVVKFRYGIFVAILSSVLGVMFACFICKYI